MKTLSKHEAESVQGGIVLYDNSAAATTPATTPASSSSTSSSSPKAPTVVDPFVDHMKKMFGASAGRDLAKLAQKYRLVDVVNSIFGW